MKLTDTQLVLLSKASQREDHAVELPGTLKGGAAHKVVGKLLTEGLLEEIRARGELPVWRRDDEEGSRALRITKRGLQAIQADEENAPSVGAHKGSGSNPAAEKKKSGGQAAKQPKEKSQSENRAQAAKVRGAVASKPRSESKQAEVIALLSRPQGSTVSAIMEATGWQQHSIRGFFSAVVRKKLQLTLVSEKASEERIYRIVPANGAKPAAKHATGKAA